ncbi:nucleotidyltransferase family protein [Aurantiacibacter rhizosphaerae]|uniref:NTP transferase domain-containing protein n=1 Tax=Aurantiacibacter rhizosphaerae TaxID=2691582 RepID=A0A844XDQ7_9SPHN|nr:nucleotidyltransferase family protein [Aurantiacibacter rhizosphaerae]MWV27883.1 NTP transferase domain-containing protein [Aurantiacibacter rhizosphaerae]
MIFSAVVLAGTRPGGDPLAKAQGTSHKALIEIEGRPLLERVLTALQKSGAQPIGVSCDDPAVMALATQLGAQVLPTGRGPSDSTAIAFERFGGPMVVTTADHALLESEWVRQLVADTPDDADIGIMLARREQIEATLPGSRRTYMRFADGQWSGCNLFFLKTPKARAAIDSWQAVEADRKRPWRIARRLGIGTLLTYALGRLKLAQGIIKLGRRLGIEARLVQAESGLAAVDADKPSDLEDIRSLLSPR